jgi:tetratricopeptide (TPR) repeat protein
MSDINQEAVNAALNQDWTRAVELNLQLLETQPKDIAALNRLAFAYWQQGNLSDAKTTYNQVLGLDRYNPIALKSLDKIGQVKANSPALNHNIKFFTSFLEEPGKTKTVSLIRPAHPAILVNLSPGIPVSLNAKKRRVGVENQQGQYIGCLPDDIGFRLCHLIKLGYLYETFIKSSNGKQVVVFIKELSRSTKNNNLPSFPLNHNQSNSNNFMSLHPLDETPIDTTPTGEEDMYSE